MHDRRNPGSGWPRIAAYHVEGVGCKHHGGCIIGSFLGAITSDVALHVVANYVTHYAVQGVAATRTTQTVSIMRMHLRCPSRTVLLFMFVLALKELKVACAHALSSDTLDSILITLNMLMAFVLVVGCMTALDQLHDAMWKMAHKDEEGLLAMGAVKKWQSISQGFSKWGQPEKDKAYSYPESGCHLSASHVLAEISAIYILLLKGLVMVLYILFLIGVDLYTNIVPLLIMSGVTTLLGAMQIQGSFSTLVALAVSKPFYVGEIVGLSSPGGTPADVPTMFVVRFVEAITWFHIVIRDFKKKQIFIPLQQFASLSVHNWTRRPAHLCYWMLTTSSGGKDGSQLTALASFTRKWIAAHELIDHTGYTKAVVKGQVGVGLKMEVVFYPKVGKDVYQLRAEFVITIMDAATRLGLTLIPEDIVTPYPETLPQVSQGVPVDKTQEAPTESAMVSLEDLLTSRPGLVQRAGYAKAAPSQSVSDPVAPIASVKM
jgi:small-conductance mechanosensitive channel